VQQKIEFIKNHQFGFLNYFRIRELLFPVPSKNNQNRRTTGPSYYRSFEEPAVFMKELAMK
jgi:hypothetical protein